MTLLNVYIYFWLLGNKSAEAEEEEADQNVSLQSSLVSAGKLDEVTIIESKKDFKAQMKAMAKKLLAHVEKTNPERADIVKKGLTKLTVEILEDFKKYQFYAVEEDCYDVDGMILPHITINKNKDKGDQIDDQCILYMFKDAVIEEKCVSVICLLKNPIFRRHFH